MRIKLSLILAIFLALALCTGLAYAGDPLDPNDTEGGDWDRDGLDYQDEFEFGTDPYNSDTDNDGLPDGWEHMNELDGTDARDAHYDADGEDDGNITGEKRAQFSEVRKIIDKWPSDGTTTIYEPILHEQEPHYDNYEEFYRAYYDLEPPHGLLYMHTNPNMPDTDGDGIMDPDDAEPLSAANDGTCDDEGCGDTEPEEPIMKNTVDIGNSEITSYTWDTDFAAFNDQSSATTTDKNMLPDADNDGL